MPTASDLKKCWKCEEDVHPHAFVCPYCRADLNKRPAPKEDHEPPYRFVTADAGADAPIPLYSPANHSLAAQSKVPYTPAAVEVVEKHLKTSKKVGESMSSLKSVLTPTALLLSGAVFFLFGLVLLLCSHEGVFTLRWNGSLWPFYFFTSLPLLFFGWRSLRNIESTEEETQA